jgi:thioredoxin-related protein
MRTKTLLSAALCAAVSLSAANAAEPVPAEGAEVGAFTQDVDAAKALAKEKGLPLLLDFTGSDWCGWCKLMDRQVFAQDAWREWAATSIVLATIDFPADEDLVPERFRARNRALSDEYGVEGYPTYVLLSADGEEIGRLGASRDATPAKFVAEIRAAFVERDPAALAAALSPEEAEEFARLKARVKAIESGEGVEGAAGLEEKIKAWEKRIDEAQKNAPDTARALQSEAVAELTALRRDVDAKRRAVAAEYGKAVERLDELRAKLGK